MSCTVNTRINTRRRQSLVYLAEHKTRPTDFQDNESTCGSSFSTCTILHVLYHEYTYQYTSSSVVSLHSRAQVQTNRLTRLPYEQTDRNTHARPNWHIRNTRLTHSRLNPRTQSSSTNHLHKYAHTFKQLRFTPYRLGFKRL